MNTALEIEDKVKDIILEELVVINNKINTKEQILNTHELEKDLGFDSLDFVEFVMVIENYFNDGNMFMTDEKLEEIKTVQDVIDAVVKLKGI